MEWEPSSVTKELLSSLEQESPSKLAPLLLVEEQQETLPIILLSSPSETASTTAKEEDEEEESKKTTDNNNSNTNNKKLELVGTFQEHDVLLVEAGGGGRSSGGGVSQLLPGKSAFYLEQLAIFRPLYQHAQALNDTVEQGRLVVALMESIWNAQGRFLLLKKTNHNIMIQVAPNYKAALMVRHHLARRLRLLPSFPKNDSNNNPLCSEESSSSSSSASLPLSQFKQKRQQQQQHCSKCPASTTTAKAHHPHNTLER